MVSQGTYLYGNDVLERVFEINITIKLGKGMRRT
jgi:hypothetical protein